MSRVCFDADEIRSRLQEQPESFQAGQIREHLAEWRKITQDQEVLRTVEGVHINFTDSPTRNRAPSQCHFAIQHTEAINNEIQDLLVKGVIVPCSRSSPEYVSPIYISYQKPYGAVLKSTAARWIRDVLHRAGVDTSRFGAHSTRSASMPRARQWILY